MSSTMSMSTMASGDPAFVLYVDHQGHPAPLSECFFATASRRLSSTVDRQHRPSTVTQVDSAFCPHCLAFHDASSAAQLGYCPKSTCLQCPICTSVVSCRKVDSCYCYGCGRCDWNSIQCELKVEAASAGSEPTKEEAAAALTQLSGMLEEKRKAGDFGIAVEEHYQKMVASWEDIVKVKPIPKTPVSRRLQFKGKRATDDPDNNSWSVEALETAMQKKKGDSIQQLESTVSGQKLQHISLEKEQTLDSAMQGKPVDSLVLQALTSAPTMSMADLLPLAIPLRSRISRRCRAELADGKPGILLKPKLNPLEGDSSLRSGHGQWWKKDSSAVHVVPRVRVVRHGSKTNDDNTQIHAFCIKVTNSTLGQVRLQISLSSLYEGEPFWDDQTTTKNPAMENLLIETLSDKRVDAFLLKTSSGSSSPGLKSEQVVLGSAEDSIVDIGMVFEVPEKVINWDAEKAMAASPPSSEVLSGLEMNQVAFAGIKLVAEAEKSGSAWFEVICATKQLPDMKPNGSSVFPAMPLSLLIEVGNGSWESSLIKANPKEEGEEADKVVFDLVVTWPSSVGP